MIVSDRSNVKAGPVVEPTVHPATSPNARSIVARCGVFVGVMAVVYGAALAYVRYSAGGVDRVPPGVDPSLVVSVAAVVCGASALAALAITLLWRGSPQGVVAALGGSLLGMFFPLATGIVLQRRGGDWAAAGVFGWIVVFYLVSLVTKTLLASAGTASRARSVGVAGLAGRSTAPTTGA